MAAKEPEKKDLDIAATPDVEDGSETAYKEVPLNKAIVASDDDEFVDPRLKDYPIPLVAKTVGLENDPT